MHQNDIKRMRMEIARTIKEVFGNRIKSLEIYDIVEVPSHWAFKIKFIVYDYFVVLFNYELDIIGFSIELGSGKYVSLSQEKHCYSNTDMATFINEIKEELELRIPDKYLIARGWM
ncbi:hypothetical protein [Vallitalea guaymasensis]|uniref:Uncharacterized protein n=1 Tax=Vallitalea guaymasensis TaxID=1185412 RepID=A0A8J8M9M6_9FIRM|nr:hypothetical protein [Vallitalea guaymasensis]QUH28887.1 hypothetical protein HYG85_08130 [Vallitalea guaymasensis]